MYGHLRKGALQYVMTVYFTLDEANELRDHVVQGALLRDIDQGQPVHASLSARINDDGAKGEVDLSIAQRNVARLFISNGFYDALMRDDDRGRRLSHRMVGGDRMEIYVLDDLKDTRLVAQAATLEDALGITDGPGSARLERLLTDARLRRTGI